MLCDAGNGFAQLVETIDPLVEKPHDFELPLAGKQRESATHFLVHVNGFTAISLVFHTYHAKFILLAHIHSIAHFPCERRIMSPKLFRNNENIEQIKLPKTFGGNGYPMSSFYIYWVATTLLVLLYLASAVTYVVKSDWVRETITGFGYPAYLVPLLTAVKIAAVIAILARFNVAISDLAYAGVLFHLLLSGLAHIGVRKPAGALPAAIGLGLLVVSFAMQNAAREVPSPYALTRQL